MITSLTIKNFALIEDAEIIFGKGLNIITGETGAGKSILLGAISMILGERASTDHIRNGADKAIIEGVFHTKPNRLLRAIFTDNDLEWNDELVLRREISTRGQNRCFVNDNLITTGLLKSIGDYLVDLHGQHEHQSLIRQEFHIEFLDAYANNAENVQQLTEIYKSVTALQRRIHEIETNKQSIIDKKEYYSFQLKEIEEVNPQPGEDESLIQEEKLASNSEKIYELSRSAYQDLYESDGAIIERLEQVKSKLNQLCSFDERLIDYQKDFDSAVIAIAEIARVLGEYNHKIVFDPERLELMRTRLMNLQKLKRKYGSIEDIIRAKEEYQGYVSLSENYDDQLLALKKELNKAIENYGKCAHAVSATRTKAAEKLDKRVAQELVKLGIEKAQFKTMIAQIEAPNGWFISKDKPVQAAAQGIDHVEFFISANAGESLKPLVKVASGGEISRIMLSLKTALAQSDKIPTMIFDEIDVGISGRIAQAVGIALSELSESHQIISITHLPQIAALAQTHFSVQKQTQGHHTITTIRQLKENERETEIAKLLGGAIITDAAIKNARDLMRQKVGFL
ncbi:DNA repair protein RecN [bacterium]|nr:DNA repair protein RecN [bacterium]NUN44432.1 DNA repair protein RecN [bacterium]